MKQAAIVGKTRYSKQGMGLNVDFPKQTVHMLKPRLGGTGGFQSPPLPSFAQRVNIQYSIHDIQAHSNGPLGMASSSHFFALDLRLG